MGLRCARVLGRLALRLGRHGRGAHARWRPLDTPSSIIGLPIASHGLCSVSLTAASACCCAAGEAAVTGLGPGALAGADLAGADVTV